MRVNGLGASALAQWAINRRVPKMVYVSSMAAYGDVNVRQVSATTSVRHSSPYGVSRWAAECYLHAFKNHLSSICVRSCTIVGKDSDYHFLAKILKEMITQKHVIRVSNPDFLSNNVIHEDTLAEFLVLLAVQQLGELTSVPVGSHTATPLSEIVSRMATATRYTGRVEWIPSTSNPFSIDVSHAEQLGFQPMRTSDTIDQWLQDALIGKFS